MSRGTERSYPLPTLGVVHPPRGTEGAAPGVQPPCPGGPRPPAPPLFAEAPRALLRSAARLPRYGGRGRGPGHLRRLREAATQSSAAPGRGPAREEGRGSRVMGMPEPPNFSWVSEGRLAGLAMPREPGHYRFLLAQGVRHLVSLTERPPPHHGCCPGVQLHRLRVPDFTPPTPEQIQTFLQLVEDANARGEAVAVHCMLGHGRTGTMLACYLLKEQKMSGGDAIREIRRLRPGSIETREQEEAVIQFCQRLQ